MKISGLSLKVLIVEDSEDDSLLMIDELRRGGFGPTYKRIETRQSFLDELSRDWELIIADYSLPSFNGADALDVLNESGLDIPFIVISGSITEEMAVTLLRSGAKDFIVKSNLSRLVPAVHRELDEASRRKEQRVLGEALKEKEELNQTILENSPTPISISVDGRLMYTNPSRLKLTGDASTEEADEHQWTLVHPDDADSLKQRRVMDLETSVAPQRYEYRIRKPDGSYAQLEALSTPIMYMGRPAELHVLHDVTQRKTFEEQLVTLHAYARDLTAAETIDAAAKVVGRAVQGIVEASFGSVGLVEGDILRFVWVFGVDWDVGGEMPIDGPGITTRAVRSGDTQLVRDVSQDGEYFRPEDTEAVSKSNLVVPIKIDGEVVATINVENPRLDAYTPGDIQILEILGNNFSSAIKRIRATEDVKASEARYRSFLDNLRDPVFVLDDDMYLYANKAAADMLGYDSPEDILGLPSYSIVSPEEREMVKQRTVARAKGENVPSKYELRLLRRDGGVVRVELNVSRIMYEGRPASLAVHRDITEQKQLEQEREETNRLNESLTKIYIPLTDPKTSISDIANLILAEAQSLTESPQGCVSEIDEVTGDLITHTFTSMMSKCDVADKKIVFRRSMDGSYPRLWGYSLTEKKPFFTNKPQTHKASRGVPEGQIPLLRYLSTPVYIGEKLLGQISLANSPRDYTENDLNLIRRLAEYYGTAIQRKRMEAALRQDEAEKTSILTSLKDPVGLVDRDHHFIWGNEALSQLFNKPLEDIIGKKCYQATFNHDHTCEGCLIQEVFDTGEGRKARMEFSEGRYFETYIEPVRGESGGILSVIEIYRDITERIIYEKRLEALHEHASTLESSLTVEEARSISLEIMSSLFNFKFVGYLEVRDSSLVGVGSIGAPITGINLPLNGKGITVKAANTRTSIRINDLRDDEDFVKGSTASLSELAVPIVVNDKTIAVLNAESDNLNDFSEEDQKLVEILASHVASVITRFKAAEQLQKSEEKYRKLFDSVNDLVFIHDLEGRFLEVNRVAEQNLGYNRYELLRMNIADLDSDTDRELIHNRFEKLEIEGQSLFQVTHIAKDGKRIETEVNAKLIEYEGKPAILSTCRDISERRRYGEKLQDLHNFAIKLGQARDIPEVYSITFKEITETIEYHRCSILVIEDGVLRDIHLKGYGKDIKWSLPLNGKGITTRVARTGETVYSPDVKLNPDYIEAAAGGDIRSELAVPVNVNKNVAAVLNVERSEVDAFTEQDQRLLEILANHTASAIVRLIQVSDLKEHEKRLTALHKCVSDLAEENSVERVWDLTLSVLNTEFSYHFIGIGVLSDEYLKYVRFQGATPPDDFKLPIDGSGITVRALRNNETQMIKDITKDKDFIAFPFVDGHLFQALSEIVVPIQVEGKPYAIINVESTQLDAFDENDRTLLEILAGHVGEAISRIQNLQELKVEEAQMVILHRFTNELAEAKTFNEAAAIAANTIQTILNTENGSLSFVEDGALHHRYVYGAKLDEEYVQPLTGPGIVVRAAVTGEPQLIPDVRNDPSYQIPKGVNIETRSELAVPVKLEGRVVAVINAESPIVDAFTNREQNLLEILAMHLNSALTRINDNESKKRYQSHLESLHGYTSWLAEAQTIDEIAEITNSVFRELFNPSSGSLSLVENDSLHFIRIYGGTTKKETTLSLSGRGITVRTVTTGEPQLVPDISIDADFVDLLENESTRSELAVPVKLDGDVIGVIDIESSTVDAFTRGDQQLMEIFANHLSSAISRIREAESKERYRNRLEILHELVLQLDAVQTIPQTAAIATNVIKNFYGEEYGGLLLIEGEEMGPVPEHSTLFTRLPLNGRGVTVKAIKEGRTVSVEDAEKDPDFIEGKLKTLSEVVVPLKVKDQVVGVLNIESKRKNAFASEDIKLAETLALHVSSTLERIRVDSERIATQFKLQKKEYEAEQASELDKMKTRFISTATHEIRTPLTSIKGYTELIQGELENGQLDTVKRYFDVVGRNVDRLVHLTDDLLDTQRIEEGRMTLNMTTFEARGILLDLFAEMTPLLTRKNQALKITKKVRGKMRGDRNRLMQVLVNLIVNASKFSPEGSLIRLSIERQGDEVLFSISDPGVGLTDEDIPKLFKPFPGIHVEGNPEGTGLGLSICMGIIEMHGGRIWVESKGLGKGATFNFTIPEAKK